MSARPFEKLPTIRAKLGSTIVVAVAVTIVLSYFLIGFALRNSPRDTEAVAALKTARQAALGRLHVCSIWISRPSDVTRSLARCLLSVRRLASTLRAACPPDSFGLARGL